MKNTGSLVVRTLCIIMTFIFLLSAAVHSVLAYVQRERKIDDTSFFPSIINIAGKPISQEKYSEKFGVYSKDSVRYGKSIANLFNAEQIRSIKKRRNGGEWMSLTNEEALYVIGDTLRIFEQYDLICIMNIDYDINVYSASSDGKEAVYDVAKQRLELLCSAVGVNTIGIDNEVVLILSETDSAKEESYMNEKSYIVAMYYLRYNEIPDSILMHYKSIICQMDGGGFLFYSGKIYFIEDLSRAEHNDIQCIVGK